jgi:hypothetical protein
MECGTADFSTAFRLRETPVEMPLLFSPWVVIFVVGLVSCKWLKNNVVTGGFVS